MQKEIRFPKDSSGQRRVVTFFIPTEDDVLGPEVGEMLLGTDGYPLASKMYNVAKMRDLLALYDAYLVAEPKPSRHGDPETPLHETGH